MNSNQTPVLFPYPPDELFEKIREIVRSELSKNTAQTSVVEYSTPGLVQKPLYKAFEVCRMLQISRQTLHAWTKEGILTAYKIKSRVFFLASDIEKIITLDLKK